MKSNTYYKSVGLTVLILAVGLVFASIWLSTGFDTKSYKKYLVLVHESVAGLSVDSGVKYSGVDVGKVVSIRLSQSNPQVVKVLLDIEEQTPITTATYATLVTKGITGTNYLELSAKTPSTTPLEKLPGEPYPIIPTKASFINQIENHIDTVSKRLQDLLNEKNLKNIEQTFHNLEAISATIANNDEYINQLFSDLPRIVKDLNSGIAKFNEMANEMARAGIEAAETMESAKSTIDQFKQQVIPALNSLMRDFGSITNNLRNVTEQVRRNPSVIIRGSTPPKPGPGER